MEKYARFKYQPCLPLGADGRRVTASAQHQAVSRRAACEGMVLLKNENGALPLQKGERVALFGKATIEYIKGGGGSGDVYCPYIRSIYDGFRQKEQEGKVSVYMPLIDFYRAYVERESQKIPTQEQINAVWDVVNAMEFCQKRDDMTYDTFHSMHVSEAKVPDALIGDAAANADTAIVTFSRFSAEGTDRRPTGGDYYLSALEKELLQKLTASFRKVIVIQNTGAVMDCEDVADDPRVQGLLLGWQAGMEGGAAIADILCGDVNPSGKLPDTVIRSYDCCPSRADFIESMQYVPYSEDVYVGYRYYSTIPGKADCVRYPFGFGLSYTTFALSGAVCGESDGTITAAVRVTNTGSVPGREVVQLYYAAPAGKLGKPSRALAAFRKTRLLSPGESETLALSFDVAEMASYDDLGKVQKAAYVLEKGEYTFYLGTSLFDVQKLAFTYTAASDVIAAQCETRCRPYLLPRRLCADGTYEALPTDAPADTSRVPGNVTYAHTQTEIPFDRVGEDITLADFVDQMTVDEMITLVEGHAPTGVANTGCFGPLPRLGIPAVPTADGPAGLRLDVKTGILTTAFPCATLLAATWDPDVCFSVGAAAAAEVRENNIGVWLAPALNIHRNPLCGRNFEYFSEDPVLAGQLCAAEIRGIQSQHIAVSLKHFACNNKEVNRYASDSRVSERALREIYLKPFEIAVKQADPWTIMSSYNLINGYHTGENYDLLTGILREEWGYRGMVITDWCAQSTPSAELRAGNDLKMPTGDGDDIRRALESGQLTTAHLKQSVMRILAMFEKLQ